MGLMIHDVLSQSLSEILFNAEHDEYSGLPNKKSLFRSMRQYQKRGSSYSLLLYRIENYTEMLLNLGSDQVLAAVLNTAELIKKNHGYDVFHTSTDILCCLSGESESESAGKTGRVLKTLNRPLLCDDTPLKINVRVSLTYSDHDSLEWRQDYDHGLLTLCEAEYKNSNFMIFHRVNKTLWQNRLGLIHQLAGALEEGQFKAVYQPLYNSDKKIIGFEALCRWSDSTGEPVSPGIFIPMLEESGLISEFSLLMMNLVLKDMKTYRFLMDNAPVYINLSPELINEEFEFERITALIDDAAIPHEKIGFEITETMITSDLMKFRKAFDYLKDQRFHTALDDFGTGYSNLSRILDLPFDKIKLDQSFVNGMKMSLKNQELLKMFIEFINRVGCISLIEGIETEEDMNEFQEMNCLEYQGFYLSEPLDPESFQ